MASLTTIALTSFTHLPPEVESDLSNFSVRVRAVRLERRLSQHEVANGICSITRYRQFERGKTRVLSFTQLIAISNALEIECDFIARFFQYPELLSTSAYQDFADFIFTTDYQRWVSRYNGIPNETARQAYLETLINGAGLIVEGELGAAKAQLERLIADQQNTDLHLRLRIQTLVLRCKMLERHQRGSNLVDLEDGELLAELLRTTSSIDFSQFPDYQIKTLLLLSDTLALYNFLDSALFLLARVKHLLKDAPKTILMAEYFQVLAGLYTRCLNFKAALDALNNARTILISGGRPDRLEFIAFLSKVVTSIQSLSLLGEGVSPQRLLKTLNQIRAEYKIYSN